MEAQLEQLEGDRARLTVEVPAGEVQHAVEHATHDLVDRVKVPGFRAGRVPQEVLLSRIGKQRLYSEAIESHISSWFWNAARSNRAAADRAARLHLRPADRRGRDLAVHGRVPRPAGRRAGRLDEARGAEARRRGQRRGRRSAARSPAGDRSPRWLAVDGRPARFGDVAVVDIASDDGPGPARLRRRARLGAACRGAREGDPRLSFPARPSRSAGRVATARRASRPSRSRSCTRRCCRRSTTTLPTTASEFDTLEELRADIVERIRDAARAGGREPVPRRTPSTS